MLNGEEKYQCHLIHLLGFTKTMTNRKNLIKRGLQILILFSFTQCHVKVKIQTKSTCKEYLNGISEMWKIDSIGLMGSWNAVYLVILEKCDLVGLNWSEIEPFFGKANKEGSLFSCYSYRYYSKIDSIYKIPVREFIEIDVDNDKKKIIRIKRGYNDSSILK